MNGRDKRKSRTSLKRILEESSRVMEAMRSSVEESNNPFANAGAANAEHLDAVKAYSSLADSVDQAEINDAIAKVNERSWTNEEMALVAQHVETIAKTLAAL